MAEGIAKGMAKGIAEGMAKGVERGRWEERLQNARNLKALGLHNKLIAQATGLSEEDIINL